MPLDKTKMIIPADPKYALISYAAGMRWQKEVGGFALNGLHIATDDRSKLMLAGARAAAETNPDFNTQWKSADNSFVSLNAQELITISNAVLAHVSNCFSIEAQVLASINDGLISEPAQIDAAFA
ncbi:DUF4376 domain-containing protein [Pseudochrobactrum sp. MP213Fo]|uniref:DUF4376 domain-containing protein n=1 Tax=Pseudochrobactrum sp. MP213Fo TaxID=3022250 RepID=UPI003B9FE7E7